MAVHALVACLRGSPRSAQRRARVQFPITPCTASEAILEEHADDGHHSQTPVRELSVELILAGSRVLHGAAGVWDAQHSSVHEVAGVAGLVLDKVACVEGTAEGNDLNPAPGWHLRYGTQAIGHVCKLDPRIRSQVTGPLEVLWDDVTQAGPHRHAAVLDLGDTAPPEIGGRSIHSVACWVPEAHWRLHAQLVLIGTHGRVCVECPVAPRRASEAVLVKHTNDRHHCKAAARNLRVKAPLALLRIVNALGPGDAKRAGGIEVPWATAGVVHEHVFLHGAAEGDDLDPARPGHLGQSCQAIWHISECDSPRW